MLIRSIGIVVALATSSSSAPAPCIGSYAGLGAVSSAASTQDSALNANIVLAAAVTVSALGDVYFCDGSQSSVRMITSASVMVVVGSSGAPGYSGDGSLGPLAQVNYPQALLVLPNLDLIIADTGNAAIRLLSGNTSIISTLAGPADGIGVVTGLAVDAHGNIYFSESAPVPRVRLLAAGTLAILSVVGASPASEGWSGDGGLPFYASLLGPYQLAVTPSGSVLIADRQTVRAVSPSGVITSLLGGSPANPPPYGYITGVAADDAFAYFTDFDRNNVWRIALSGSPSSAPHLIAGIGVAGNTGDGNATAMALSGPVALALVNGSLYVAEFGGSQIRRLDLRTHTLVRIAGSIPPLLARQVETAQTVALPSATFALGSDGLYAMVAPSVVERLTYADWSLRSFAGTGLNTHAGDGGPATAASLVAYISEGVCENTWNDIETSSLTGDVYIAESLSATIRRIDVRTNIIGSIIGNGRDNAGARLPPRGSPLGSPATSVAIGAPMGLVVDARDNVLFSYGGVIPCNFSYGQMGVWGIGLFDAASGAVSHLACAASQGYSGDGGPAATAECCNPFVGGIDAAGNVYFADICNHVVRVIFGSNLTVATVAGVAGNPGWYGDGGPATLGGLSTPVMVRVFQPRAYSPLVLYISDLDNGRIRRVAGGVLDTIAGNGDVSFFVGGDGGPATAAALGGVYDIAVDEAGNVHSSTNVGGQLRATVLGDWIHCPAGFMCPCATPIACTDAAHFCPGNTLSALPVSAGFYSLPESAAGASTAAATSGGGGASAWPRSAQAPCPVGSFCSNGTRSGCLPGTYGTSPRRSTSGDCIPCPPGTYSALSSQTSPGACVPCPLGTFSATPGAAQCSPCNTPAFVPLRGSVNNASCLPLRANPNSSSTGAIANGIVSLANISSYEVDTLVTPDDSATTLLIQALVAIAVLLVVVVPLCVTALVHSLPRWRVAHRAVLKAYHAIKLVVFSADIFSLAHWLDDGEPPVKRRTFFGGAMTSLAFGCIAAIGIALIIQFLLSNTLIQRAVLPVTISVTALIPNTTTLVLPPAVVAEQTGAFLFVVASGIGVQITATGPACGVTTWRSAALQISDFDYTVLTDAISQASTHTFLCSTCGFTPLSSLSVEFDASCQMFMVHTAAVSSEGTLTLTSFSVTGPLVRTSSSSDANLALVDVFLEPTLELYSSVGAVAPARGYRLSVSSYAATLAPAPLVTTLVLHLSQAAYFYSTTLVPLQTRTQLFSSLVGLLGLTSVFAFAFGAMEYWACDKGVVVVEGSEGGGGSQHFRRSIKRTWSCQRPMALKPAPVSSSALPCASDRDIAWAAIRENNRGVASPTASAAALNNSGGGSAGSLESLPSSPVAAPIDGPTPTAAGVVASTSRTDSIAEGMSASQDAVVRSVHISLFNPLRIVRRRGAPRPTPVPTKSPPVMAAQVLAS